jgi:hypothetical protein
MLIRSDFAVCNVTSWPQDAPEHTPAMYVPLVISSMPFAGVAVNGEEPVA